MLNFLDDFDLDIQKVSGEVNAGFEPAIVTVCLICYPPPISQGCSLSCVPCMSLDICNVR